MKNIKIIIGVIIILAVFAYLGNSGFFNRQNYEIINESKGVIISAPETSVVVKNDVDELSDEAVTPYGQESCQNSTRRSIAVMLAIDAITRPLSGISEADIVFEMPVITDSITRLMAVFGCIIPTEIGSIRSARHDFIDLAKSVDAIFVHWGGSHFALDKLKTGAIDDLDALANPYGVFYRKNNLPAPHNGFTNGEKILAAAAKLGFRMENNFKGYSRENLQPANYDLQTIIIGYPGEFRVEYKYDAATNSYLRWRGGKKEIDRNNKKQVTAKNVVVLYAQSKQIEGEYNDVVLEGKGKAEFYRNGEKIEGVWQKNASSAKLYFLDNFGTEIKFATGNIWVEIIQTNQKTEWLK
ncbi:DUF3048 domain-containing protein [Patescibacteria group bacterium]|nr:DUF3048 domain-containing protein [Patescibacteria group bacterium]MBU4580171.1 DUF3048 domain-containing protein [Patescibacteria group bacterium]